MDSNFWKTIQIKRGRESQPRIYWEEDADPERRKNPGNDKRL